MSKEKAKEEELNKDQECPLNSETQETQETTEATEASENDVQEEEVEKTPEELAAEKQLETEMKLQDMTDKYMRLSAEFDNYRKRTLKERMDLMKTAGEKIFMDILPVMDNFERAMNSMDSAKEIEPVVEGINLIYTRFADFLKQNGLEEIETKKADFDVELHEAITKMPAPSKKLRGKIIDCVEKGYKLNDKVVRYAKVVVGE
ncbi:MAG: nucleotide exchange factor GrpE [Marinifilaceae bacterium]